MTSEPMGATHWTITYADSPTRLYLHDWYEVEYAYRIHLMQAGQRLREPERMFVASPTG